MRRSRARSKEIKLKIELGVRPDQISLENNYRNNLYDKIGLSVENIPDINGVKVVDINPYSKAYENNLRVEDIITDIGNTKIKSDDDYNNELEKYQTGDPIMLRIVRDGDSRYEAFLIE